MGGENKGRESKDEFSKMETTRQRQKTGWNVKSMCAIALMAAVIAVSAWITVPFTIPFTMQIFGVAAALALLGGRNGTIAI